MREQMEIMPSKAYDITEKSLSASEKRAGEERKIRRYQHMAMEYER